MKNESQAVPSELARLTRYEPTATACQGEGLADMESDPQGDYVLLSDIQSLFSHSAATGKVPEDERAKFMQAFPNAHWSDGESCPDQMWAIDKWQGWNTRAALASPADPLAGKADIEGAIKNTRDAYSDVGIVGEALDHLDTLLLADKLRAPLAAAVPAEEANDTERMARLGRYVTDFATKGGWIASEGEGACEFIQRMCYQTGWDDAKEHAPAEPAPIQASALTDERAIEIHDSMFPHVEWEREKVMGNVAKYAQAIEREVLARLSKPTAQGTANKDVEWLMQCAEEAQSAPEVATKIRAHCMDAAKREVRQSPAQVTGEPASIDTPEFRKLLGDFATSHLVGERMRAATRIIAHVDRHIAAQAPADRDAQNSLRWQFMMHVADNEGGPEEQALEALNGMFDENRAKSEQLEEVTDAAMAKCGFKSQPAASHGAVEGEQNEGGEHA